MFKRYMSVLYVGCMKFLINRFVENLCPAHFVSWILLAPLFYFIFFYFLKPSV